MNSAASGKQSSCSVIGPGAMKRVGILGGTFDPIHKGHLALARHFTQLLQLTQLVLMPAGQPWRKSGVTAVHHRLAMTRLAAHQLRFPTTAVTVACDEIDENCPSYTVHTLANWRACLGARASLSLLIGADQLLQLDHWRDWLCLFEYAHVCAATRPGFELSQAPPRIMAEIAHRNSTVEAIRTQPHGLFLLDTRLALDICASRLRERLRSETTDAPDLFLHDLPADVWRYIRQHHLY